MQKHMLYAATAAVMLTGAFANAEEPDPNPVTNVDGTKTWYVGNNTSYPVIQTVVTACTAGDEIVVMAGTYSESLDFNKQDVTLRPAVASGATDANGGFQKVTFWNPTTGSNASNGWAIKAGATTDNSYIGRPRAITQLANGSIAATKLPVGGAGNQEWVATATYVDMALTSYTNAASLTGMQKGLEGVTANLAMNFSSRSIDKVAIRAEDNCAATFSYCDIAADNGFGGGVMVIGAGNSAAFVGCKIHDTYSGGQDSGGQPVHAVSITGGSPLFAGCSIYTNQGGANGIIYQSGGTGSWSGCMFGGTAAAEANNSPVSNGIYVATGGAAPSFSSCTFSRNNSRFGTVYFDSTSNTDTQQMTFTNSVFTNNTTTDSQYGAVAYCTDSVASRNPLVVFDRCTWDNAGNNGGTQGSSTAFQKDVSSNYFPKYRLLRDVSTGVIAADTQGAGVANAEDGSVDGNPADVNGDGVVNGADLAAVLGAWD